VKPIPGSTVSGSSVLTNPVRVLIFDALGTENVTCVAKLPGGAPVVPIPTPLPSDGTQTINISSVPITPGGSGTTLTIRAELNDGSTLVAASEVIVTLTSSPIPVAAAGKKPATAKKPRKKK
jgi:hypothetical protein